MRIGRINQGNYRASGSTIGRAVVKFYYCVNRGSTAPGGAVVKFYYRGSTALGGAVVPHGTEFAE